MSLRSTIVLVLSAVAVLWAIADSVLLQSLVSTQFDRITEQAAIDAVDRAAETLDAEVQDLRQIAEGLAVSPILRAAIKEGDKTQLSMLLDRETLSRTGVDMAIVVGVDGEVLHYFGQDALGDKVRFRAFPSGSISNSNPLLKASESERLGSILKTEHGFLAVCAYPVSLVGAAAQDLGSLLPRPEVGQAVLITGRLVEDEVRRDTVGHGTITRLTDISNSDLSESQVRGLQLLEREGQVNVVEELEGGGLVSFICLDDAEGKPSLLLQVELSPNALLAGRRMYIFLALSTLGTSAVIFLVLLRLLQRGVVAPLSRLTRHAIDVGRTEDTTVRLKLNRRDEIGQLSLEFDRMLDKLEESRRQVIAAARLAGMSEIATGVLHNVGNVLNSVNVSRSLMERKLEVYAIPDLERTVEVLRENEGDLATFLKSDPRGAKLLPFLHELTQNLKAQHGEVLVESENLRKSVDHVADLVRSQQAYAGSRGVFELVSLEAELENALKISVQAFGRDLDLEVQREYDTVPNVKADRHKLIEILINLVQNAKQAMASADVQQPSLRVGVHSLPSGRVELWVADNGVGIAKDHLVRIFGHGFTTKTGGHGFGLHVSANAATEMEGELRAHSEGPGQGAKFTLSFLAEVSEQGVAA
ncbi:MAG: signal transduction histidine kinase [Planctomycetota bacterium]|jgi:signal transduction histidine kinase